jgi:hypothetical protein
MSYRTQEKLNQDESSSIVRILCSNHTPQFQAVDADISVAVSTSLQLMRETFYFARVFIFTLFSLIILCIYLFFLLLDSLNVYVIIHVYICVCFKHRRPSLRYAYATGNIHSCYLSCGDKSEGKFIHKCFGLF